MVVNDQWMSYREDDYGKAQTVRDFVLNDTWCVVDNIFRFTRPIYEMLQAADTNAPILHKVYEMWDLMIEQVKNEIYWHEGNQEYESSPFYEVVHNTLINWWNINYTPLHCLGRSLNPKLVFYLFNIFLFNLLK